MQLVFASVFVMEENPESGGSGDVGGAVQNWVGFHRRTRWSDTPSHSICCFYMLHRTHPHNQSTYSASAQTQRKFPPLYFRVCRAHSVTHRLSEGNHTPSVQDSLWVFFFSLVSASLAERWSKWSISGLQKRPPSRWRWMDGPQQKVELFLKWIFRRSAPLPSI